MDRWSCNGPCAPQISCTVITPASLPAGIHDANHRESDAPPHDGALACGAGMLAAALGTVEVAAGYLNPEPRAGDPPLDNALPANVKTASIDSMSIATASKPLTVL
jgi:hypothetical protein